MKRSMLVLLVLTLAVSVILSGCGSQGGGAGGKKEEVIKIGAIYPLSGNMAALGEESLRGVELAAKVRNEKGGINGKKIEIVKADAPDANAAQAEANRLITQQNIKVLVGTYSSSLSYTATEVAERNKVPYFEFGAIADNITARGFKYTFRTCAPASDFGRTAMKFIEDVIAPKLGSDPKNLRLAVVHEDSLYGSTVAKVVKEIATQKGWNIVTIQPYSAKAVDLSSVVVNLKNAKPDVLIGVSYVTDAILFWRQSKELDFNPKVFIGCGGGHTMKDFQAAFGNEVDGIFDVDFPQYAINPKYAVGIEEFVSMYEKTYGHKPRSGHSLVNYMGALTLFDILEKAGSLDADAIAKAAQAYQKPMGSTVTGWGVMFDSSNQNTLARTNVMQWQKGELVTVWPKEAAVADIIYVPLPTWAERAKK